MQVIDVYDAAEEAERAKRKAPMESSEEYYSGWEDACQHIKEIFENFPNTCPIMPRDIIYQIVNVGCKNCAEVRQYLVNWIFFSDDGYWFSTEPGDMLLFEEHLGKRWFLTKEEAEAALSKKQEPNVFEVEV